MSRLIDLAEAVRVGLNAETFSMIFTPIRTYRPVFDLQEMATLRVSVVPKAILIVKADRLRNQRDLVIDIGIQQKITTPGQGSMDALMDLVEEIETYLEAEDNRTFGTAVWVSTENAPVFSQEHLADLRQFTSILTVTYRSIQ